MLNEQNWQLNHSRRIKYIQNRALILISKVVFNLQFNLLLSETALNLLDLVVFCFLMKASKLVRITLNSVLFLIVEDAIEYFKTLKWYGLCIVKLQNLWIP